MPEKKTFLCLFMYISMIKTQKNIFEKIIVFRELLIHFSSKPAQILQACVE